MTLEKTTTKISTWQFFILLILSRMFLLLTYTPRPQQDESGSIGTVAILFSFLMNFLLVLPIYFLNKTICGQGFRAACRRRLGNALGSGLLLLYALLFLLISANTLLGFQFFFTNTVYVHAAPAAILISMLLLVWYALHLGLEPLCRVTSIIFAVFLPVMAFILITQFSQISVLNLQPLQWSDASYIGRSVYYFASNFMEFTLIPIFSQNINKGRKKGFVFFVCTSSIISALTTFILMGSLGAYGATQLFPIFTAAQASEVSIFQRLDSLYMAIWVIIAFARASLYALAGSILLRDLLPEKFKRKANLLAVLVLFAVCLPLQSSFVWIRSVGNFFATGIPFILFALLFPLLLLITRRRDKGEEASQ